MRNDLTEIVIVVDRSASMNDGREEFEYGVNKFIEEQKKVEGEANFTLIEFDDSYEVVHDGINIKNAPKYNLVPRGMTALNDAVGKTIIDVGKRLSNMQEKDRPGLVTVLIVTDGGENSSKEFYSSTIRDMVKHQEDVYSWVFTYVGADFDAVKTSGSIGLSNSSMNISKSKASKFYTMHSGKMGATRRAVASGQSIKTAVTSLSYTDEEKEELS